MHGKIGSYPSLSPLQLLVLKYVINKDVFMRYVNYLHVYWKKLNISCSGVFSMLPYVMKLF